MSLPCKQARSTDFSGVVFMGRAFSFLEREKSEDRKVHFQGSFLFQDSQSNLQFSLSGSPKSTFPKMERVARSDGSKDSFAPKSFSALCQC